jgi:5-methylcytosine-specific restriction endonuclease McrA
MHRDSWKRVHGELTRLARSKGAYDAEEARWLLEGKRVRVHEPLGFATFLSYLEHVFGYGPRLASERLRVAEALAGLPALNDALASGDLCWSAVRELTRVAVPATEAEWIAAAREKSMREVEDMVSGRRSGDRPGDPADPATKREVLRLELTGDGLAAFREARRRLELDVGHSLDDDAFVRMLAHHALGGPTDPGRAAYQVAMTVCPQCRRGTRDGAGRELAVEPHVVEAALCDAQHIGDTHVGGVPDKASQTIPPRIRRLIVRRAHGRCEVTGCRSAKYLEIHHIIHRADGGTHDPSFLILACSAHHAALHRGALHVSGAAPDRLEFRRRHGTWPAPLVRAASQPPPMKDAASEMHADALDALTRLGFSAAQARQALAGSSGAGDIETLLREALARLRPPVHVARASEPGARCWLAARRAASSSRTSDGACGPAWPFTLAAAGRSAAARCGPAVGSPA